MTELTRRSLFSSFGALAATIAASETAAQDTDATPAMALLVGKGASLDIDASQWGANRILLLTTTAKESGATIRVRNATSLTLEQMAVLAGRHVTFVL